MQTISLVTLLPSLLAAFNLNYASAATADDAERELAEFDKKWGEKYPMIARSWRTVWANVIPFFKFPP
jgi:transposase-like protein